MQAAQSIEICIQLINILEKVHQAGITYNDLKPDNIMLNNNSKGQVKVTLIDYGFANTFIDDYGDHIE